MFMIELLPKSKRPLTPNIHARLKKQLQQLQHGSTRPTSRPVFYADPKAMRKHIRAIGAQRESHDILRKLLDIRTHDIGSVSDTVGQQVVLVRNLPRRMIYLNYHVSGRPGSFNNLSMDL